MIVPSEAFQKLSGLPHGSHSTLVGMPCQHALSACIVSAKIMFLLPPVNWQWVEEGDGHVRREAWSHTPTVSRAVAG